MTSKQEKELTALGFEKWSTPVRGYVETWVREYNDATAHMLNIRADGSVKVGLANAIGAAIADEFDPAGVDGAIAEFSTWHSKEFINWEIERGDR